MNHFYNRFASDNFSWVDFTVPSYILTQIKKQSSCRINFVIAKAKSILSKRPLQGFLDWPIDASTIRKIEIDLAEHLAVIWSKHYKSKQKEFSVGESLRREQLIVHALKVSKSLKKGKKSLDKRCRNFKKNQKKNKKNSNAFEESFNANHVKEMGELLTKQSLKPKYIFFNENHTKVFEEPVLTNSKCSCVLCSGTGQLIDGNKSYSCPACSNQSSTKKEKSFKESPKLGNRKLKF